MKTLIYNDYSGCDTPLFITTTRDVKHNITKIYFVIFVINTIFVTGITCITIFLSRNMAKNSSIKAKISKTATQNDDNPSVERTLKTPQQVIESVIFSGIKRGDNTKRLNIYEERLLAFIILEAQQCLNGVTIGDHISDNITVTSSLLTPEMQNQRYYPMKIPLKEIAGQSNNYDHIAEACANLMSQIVRIDDETHIRLRQLIIGADYAKDGTGYLYFEVPRDVWFAILDFSKGFRKYDIQMAITLNNPYSYLLYKFVASQKGKESDWPVSYFREQLQLNDKYPRISDLKQKILTPAIKELDALSPVSCKLTFYSSKKARGENRRGARTLDRVKITPIMKLGEGSHDELAYKYCDGKKINILPPYIVEYLKNRLLYTDVYLDRHAEKLIHAYKIMKGLDVDFKQFLENLAPFVDKVRPDSYPKFVMSCINKRVAEIEKSRNIEEQETADAQKQAAVPVKKKAEANLTRLESNKKDSEFKTLENLIPPLFNIDI